MGWQIARLEFGADERDDVLDRGNAAKAFSGFGDPIAQCSIGKEQELIGVAQPLEVFAAEAAALHADDVEPGEAGAVAHDLAIGDDVALHTGHAADHRMLADPDKLMNGAQPAEHGVVLDDDVAGKGRIVRHDHMVGDLTIMGDMGADHEQAVVANPGDHPAAGRSGVHRHIFADPIAAADDQCRRFAAIFEILRLEPDRGERKNARSLADCRMPVDDHVRTKAHPGAEGHMLADDAIRADRNVLGQLCSRRDDGRGVDLRHRELA